MNDTLQYIEQVIRNGQGGEQSLTTHELEEIEKLKSRTEYLPYLVQYIPVSLKDSHLAVNTFIFLRDLLIKRGCLLTASQIQDHLSSLFKTIMSCCSTIVANTSVLNTCADCVAISYRFCFELLYPNSPPFEELFSLLRAGSDNSRLSLVIMASIVKFIKEPMPHLTDTQSLSLRTGFIHSQLSRYFDAAAQAIHTPSITPDSPIVTDSLSLMVSCLKILVHDEDIFRLQLQVPSDWLPFYSNPAIPQSLFDIYRSSTPNTASLAIDVLILFSSATETSWKIAEKRMEFVELLATNLIDILSREVTDEKLFISLSRLVFRVGCLLPLTQFLISPTSVQFFSTIQDFSRRSFSSREASTYILSFWSRVSEPARKLSDNPQFLSIFPTVFSDYLSALLSMPDKKCFFEDVGSSVSSLQLLWRLAMVEPSECFKLVNDSINSLSQSLPDSILSLSLLMIIVTSQLVPREICDWSFYGLPLQSSLLTSVFKLLSITDQMRDGRSEDWVIFERSVLQFATYFKRDFFSSKKPQVNTVYAAMESDPKSAFDLLINRFLADLQIFRQSPELLLEILKYVDEILKSAEEFSSSNKLLNSLTERQYTISFEGVEPTHLKKLLPFLNSIYAKTIKNADGWAKFLPYFDQQFVSIRNSATPGSVFCLYREIYGVLKGIGMHAQFLIVVRWFTSSHLDDTLSLIAKFGGEIPVVKAIIQTWYVICANKGRKLVFPKGSAEGLGLFHSTLSIIAALNQSMEVSQEKIWLIMKLILPSIGAKYTNFGIMKHFGDNSLEQMLEIMFAVLHDWGAELIQIPKASTTMISCLRSVAEVESSAIISDERLNDSLRFLNCVLLKDNAEDWKAACECVGMIMESCQENEFTQFRPHFVAILDEVINGTNPTAEVAAPALYYCIYYDREFVGRVMSLICGSFDEVYRENVESSLQALMSQVELPPSSGAGAKSFKASVAQFKKSIRRTAIRLSSIGELSEFFYSNN